MGKLAKLSLAALLAGASVAVAQEAPVVTPGGTKVQIYGRLELNSAYEDAGQMGHLMTQIPASGSKDAEPQGRTTLSIARTRLGLNLSGPSKEGEPDLAGKFEADFSGNSAFVNFSGTNGSNSGFRVRQSWGSVKFKDIGLTILFGQTDDLISPIDPPSINPSSLNGAGNIGNRRPQIRVTQALGPAEIAVAATQDRLTDDTKAPATPAIQGRLGVKLPATWAGEKANLAAGVSGHFARNEAANADDKNRTPRGPDSYSINADLSLPIIDILALTGEFFTGQNLRRYGDGSLGNNTTYGDKGKDGTKSIGWWSALALKLPANFSIATGVGMESLSDDKSEEAVQALTTPGAISNMFIFGNVAYNFTSATKLTFEYTNLSAKYDDESKNDGSLNRFELNFRYDFK